MFEWTSAFASSSRTSSKYGLLAAAVLFVVVTQSNQAPQQQSSVNVNGRAFNVTPAPATTGARVPTALEQKCLDKTGVNCEDGLIFPLWRPVVDIGVGDRVGRGLVYFLAILWMFLGVSIVSDRFMASIEVITSKEREVVIHKENGETVTFTVRIWNETVSNLTLMALGSSAPEILLSVIEVCGRGFESGDLGPNTIVGSAAFNLFMIIAICVYVIPEGEVRRQKHLDVFFVTATWSLFAYAWLYLIIAVFTPSRVDVWEGVITFLCFPVTVGMAYAADQKMIQRKFLPKLHRASSRGVIEEGEDLEMNQGAYKIDPNASDDQKLFEKTRMEFIELMKDIRKKNPNISPEKLQQQAEAEMIARSSKSRAFYRVQATRRLTGGGDIVKKNLAREHHKSMDALHQAEAARLASTARVFFEPAHYTVLENVGSFNVVITRDGGPPGLTIMVDYYTEDGSANGGADYMPVSGTLTFYPDDTSLNIPIEVLDDDVFEEDEHFYVHMHNLRVKTKDGIVYDPAKLGGVPVAEFEDPTTATVMILDDDHAGVFAFESETIEVPESCGKAQLTIKRSSGARGKVRIPYKSFEGTAKPDVDFDPKEGEIEFDNDETEQTITIGIYDKEEYERTETFHVELYDPIWVKKLSDETKVQERFLRRMERKKEAEAAEDQQEEAEKEGDDENIADMGKPRLGEKTKCVVNIHESKEFHNIVDTMMKTTTGLVLSSSSWKEQFIEALTVSAGDDDDEGGDDEGEEGKEGEEGESEEAQPTWSDYAMHFIAVPWKLFFAFIPPTDYFGGWACFVCSILMIGLCTAMIGDLASHLGCTIGLRDAVTAISFVALGTSVPDTFASKVSAVQDPYADNAVGNVTGSNGVNVFLGIGIAWTMAAVYHWVIGTEGGFKVEPGSLGFSLTIFTIEAFVCIFIMVIRRHPKIGGELGGPKWAKVPTACLLVGLWLSYVIISALEAYCIIPGF